MIDYDDSFNLNDSFNMIRALLEKVEDLEGELYKTRDELAAARSSAKNLVVGSIGSPQNTVIDLVAVCLKKPNTKIAQIRAVREVTGLGLKEAKKMVAEAWYRANKLWNV